MGRRNFEIAEDLYELENYSPITGDHFVWEINGVNGNIFKRVIRKNYRKINFLSEHKKNRPKQDGFFSKNKLKVICFVIFSSYFSR